MSNLPPITTSPITKIQWEEIGAWGAGTVVGVALNGGAGAVRGLLASRAGSYGWTQAEATVEPMAVEPMAVEPMTEGLSDLDVVAVAFANGDGVMPTTALVATATGRLFRSVPSEIRVDGRVHWHEVATWAGLGVAVVLAPSPAFGEDGTLFIGTPVGIFRTQDNGQSWESCNFGLLDEDVLCLVCAPNFAESELLWAGTAGGGLYRSRNSARAWRESGFGLPDAAVQSLAVSPNFGEDRTLFVGMEGHGVYVSHDGGENWAGFALDGQSVNSLACADADWLWAGTEDGLWRVATGRGEATLVTGAGEVVLAVAATAQGQVAIGVFGSGLWLTEDGRGAPTTIVWQKPQVALHAPPVVTSAGHELFALDADGFVARSEDGGALWLEMESANPEGVFALGGGCAHADNRAGAHVLFAATSGGVSRWDGAQGAWLDASSEAFPHGAALGVDLSPFFHDDQSLLVVTEASGVLLSQDGGATWREITGPWQGQSVLRATISPDNASEMVALSVQPTETGHFAVTVWHTVDLGERWEVLAGLSSGVPAVMMAWPSDATEHAIFLATQHRVVKLYSQIDPPTLQVHQHFFDESLRVTALSPAPDYTEQGTMWAATSGGFYRSVDRGMSWGLMLELPLGLPVVWLEVTLTHIHAITLGGRAWRATL